MPAAFLVGTSGWNYADWAGRFYPRSLPARAWLTHYAREFSTTEVNHSFYRLPDAETWAGWKAAVPAGFVFAVKASRLLTHMTRLKDGRPYLANFLARAHLLGRRLGPILFQLPAAWAADVPRLAAFVERLPRGRYAFEFRHASWFVPEVLALLRRRGIACCWHDMGGAPWPLHATAGFLYARFHGPGAAKYSGSYHRRTLAARARVLRDAARDADRVYAYFNNDVEGHAIANARTFRELLGA